MDRHAQQGGTVASPPRLARKNTLNTIIEDKRGERRAERRQERQQDPEIWRDSSNWTDATSDRSSPDQPSPAPSLTSTISSYYFGRKSGDYTDSICVSDLSDNDSDIAPSLMTDLSSVRSTSPDISPQSRENPNKSLSLLIPSPGLWPAVPRPPPQQSPPRPPKIPLSPANLSLLGHDLPRLSSPPSLAGSASSDPNNSYSGPSTPDSSSPRVGSGDLWGDTRDFAGANGRHLIDTIKRPPRPKITIDTGGCKKSELGSGSAIIPQDRVSTYDFATAEFPDSPIIGSEDGAIDTGIGVELPFDALVTLNNLSLDRPSSRASSPSSGYGHEMEETMFPFAQGSPKTPASQISEYSVSQLSIPSPGDFFASLDNGARHTWHIGSLPATAIPPSSTTAEQFYRCPWNIQSPVRMQHVFELDGTALDGVGLPFAPSSASRQPSALSRRRSRFGSLYSRDDHDDFHSIIVELKDEDYDKAIEEAMQKNIDRTSDWLAMQTSYLAALRETNPANDLSAKAESELRRHSTLLTRDSPSTPIRKAVRFLETETAKHEYQPNRAITPQEAIFYHAFQYVRRSWRASDAFRHRLTRSDSIQSVRLCLPHEHLKRLKGECHIDKPDRPNPPRPVSLFPGKLTDQDEETAEQRLISRVERERQALEQINARAWVVEASRFLSGGRLLNSPARWRTIRTPKLGDVLPNGRVRNPARVLDLGGVPFGDWAWHAAREYPHAKIYTATSDPDLLDPGIRGPPNCKAQLVQRLYHLPYPDNHFHAISARSLYSHLKVASSNGQTSRTPPDKARSNTDEYDLCLEECMRVLKPGGYLEFFLMDAEIVSPGGSNLHQRQQSGSSTTPSQPDKHGTPTEIVPKDPNIYNPFEGGATVHDGSLGTKASVEFAYNLRTRGYDPTPTKKFLPRLRTAGFDDVKRAWTFMPMGSPTSPDGGGTTAMHEAPPPPPDSLSDLPTRNDPGPGIGVGLASAGDRAGSNFNPDAAAFTDPQGRKVEAIQGPVGSTADAASVSGLVGSWAWEQWMLRLETEIARDKASAEDKSSSGGGGGPVGGGSGGAKDEAGLGRMLQGIGAVLEEGKHTKAGWRCLRGWARKPLEAGPNLPPDEVRAYGDPTMAEGGAKKRIKKGGGRQKRPHAANEPPLQQQRVHHQDSSGDGGRYPGDSTDSGYSSSEPLAPDPPQARSRPLESDKLATVANPMYRDMNVAPVEMSAMPPTPLHTSPPLPTPRTGPGGGSEMYRGGGSGFKRASIEDYYDDCFGGDDGYGYGYGG